MRTALIFLAIVLWPVVVSADAASCRELYTNAPKRLAGQTLVKGEDLEKDTPGAGYGLTFGKGGKMQISLQYFAGGRKKISQHFMNKELQRGVSGATQAILQQGGGSVTVKSSKGSNDTLWASIQLGKGSGGSNVGYVLVGKVNNCLYRSYYSPGVGLPKGAALFQSFTNELQAHHSRLAN